STAPVIVAAFSSRSYAGGNAHGTQPHVELSAAAPRSARSAAFVAPNRSPPAYDAAAIARHELGAMPRRGPCGRRASPRSRAATVRVAAAGRASGPPGAPTA